MASDSAATRRALVESAKQEFLIYGFARASLRKIAAGAGLTTGAVYRRFPRGKEELFEALVAPVYRGFLQSMRELTAKYRALLETQGMEPMWASAESMDSHIDYIYDNFEAFKLLLSGSEQTPFADFSRALVELNVDLTLDYLGTAKKEGFPVRKVDREELFILTNAECSALFALVIRDVPRKTARAYARRASRFFRAGWMELLLEPPAPAGKS